MIWWHWLLLGFALLAAEMATPGGFYLLFIGLAALTVGTLAGLDLVASTWLQWLLFSALAVVSLLLFRGPLLARIKGPARPSADVDTFVGETALLLEDLPVHGLGKVELRGTTWTARNAGKTDLIKGRRVTVTRVDGLTLWVRGD